jgi:phage baseplate assembly protein W
LLSRIQIDPLDLQPRKGVGVALPFEANAVFRTTFETKEAIKFNLVNLLLTGTGERYFNLGFGSNLRNFLFQNITEAELQAVKNTISETIALYYPRVQITTFNLTFEADNNALLVEFKYRITQTNIEDEILINIEQ